MPFRIGETVGAYGITGTLGTGGMGDVYRARDFRVKRDVAVKTSNTAFSNLPARGRSDCRPESPERLHLVRRRPQLSRDGADGGADAGRAPGQGPAASAGGAAPTSRAMR
jgi:hypothetical protein